MLGFECKIYFDATALAGTPDTGTWAELTIVKDVNVPDERDEVENTTRESNGVKTFETGLRTVGVEFEIEHDPANAGYAALKAAYEANTEIAIAVMDGDITTIGKTGVGGNFKVATFPRSEPLGDHVTSSIKLVPSSFIDDYTVAV